MIIVVSSFIILISHKSTFRTVRIRSLAIVAATILIFYILNKNSAVYLFILTMASKPSVHNTEKKSKKKYTFKKLTTFENTIEISVNNLGSDGCSSGNDNLPGCQNIHLHGTSKTTNNLLTNNSPQVRKRFFKTSEENIFAIKENRFEKSTIKCTEWGVKIFKDWLKENDINDSFEFLSVSQLDKLLARFYVELRKIDGQYYSKTVYISIRAALQRHLQIPPFNVTFCINKDSAFLHSN